MKPVRKRTESRHSTRTYLGHCQPNLRIPSVIDRIEALQERIPVDEIKPLSAGVTAGRHDQVDTVRISADSGIQATREYLGVGAKFVCVGADGEYERFEVVILVCGNFE